jgi:hypothetical protein
MAYHYLRVGKKSGKTFREYSLDFSVGQGGWNVDEDVRLVQTLLHIAFHEPTSDEFRAAFPPLADVDDIPVTGTCGPITKRYISHFKKLVQEQGKALHPDAVMDPFRNNDPESAGTISGKQYAFGILLAVATKAQENKGGSNWVDDLIEDKRTHPKLAAALVATRKQARQYAK